MWVPLRTLERTGHTELVLSPAPAVGLGDMEPNRWTGKWSIIKRREVDLVWVVIHELS